MTSAPRVSVVVPAYQEEATIGELVGRVRAVDPGFEVIVVDDGSTDRTGERAREAGADVVRHPYNVGNGAAIRTGARRSRGEVIVFLDGDGQHPPEEIPDLLRHVGDYDMVVGARSSGSESALHRRIGNWGLIRFAEVLTSHRIPDLTSGFRAVKRERFFEFIHLLPNRYSYPTTITIALLQSGYFVHYVPLAGVKKRAAGRSHLHPLRDGFRFLNIILRMIMLFGPQRIFLPACAVLLAGGMGLLGYQLLGTGGIRGGSVILIMSGLIVFLFGLVAEQIAAIRRELARPRSDDR